MLIFLSFSRGGIVDVSKLDTVLENMGMNLTEKELKDLTQSLQTDGEQQMVNRVQIAEWLKAQTLEPDWVWILTLKV